MLIGELADRTGVSARALRHYDRLGLLPSRRRSNRYRDFPDHTVERVRRIRLLLDIGLDLDAAKRLLPCFADDGQLAPCQTARRALADQVQALDRSITAMRQARTMLLDALDQWPVEPTAAQRP
jgi:DNA-binding transcriptional MerR regulator